MDVATLSIKVDSTDVTKATGSLGALSNAGSGVVSMLSKLAGAVGLAVLAKRIFDTNVEFQRLSASLVTVTGSTSAANRAFAQLQDFAKTTPYELSELTQAFVDLKTRGMDASMGSLKSYGNMASAFGRPLTDLIRAISGVAMGETEAIKSFGVKAIAVGDKVAISYKGQTELIKRSSGDVEAYFKRISDANFGAGMDLQAKTLGGVLSNLKDQMASTFFAIGNSGISDRISQSITGLTQALADATPAIANFAAATASGFSSAVAFVIKHKAAITALTVTIGVLVVTHKVATSAALANTVAMVANAGSFLASTARAVALTFAVSGYSVSATAATIATTVWSGSMLAFSVAAGGLVVVLTALALAMREANRAQKDLDEALAKSKPYRDRADAGNRFLEGTRDIQENIKTLKAALGGDKTALAESGSSSVRSFRSEMRKLGMAPDSADWAIQQRIEAEAEEKSLQNALEARNQKLKDASKAQEEFNNKRREYLKGLREENATYGMSAKALDLYKAKALRADNTKEYAQHRENLDKTIAAKTLEVENELLQKNLALLLKKKEINESINPFKEYQAFSQRMDPLGADLERLKSDKATLEHLRPAMEAAGTYQRALENLRLSELKLKAESGSTWAIIGDTIAQNAGTATDAMASWMNKTDGLARTWESLGDTVRNVIADMCVQMQKAILQQQLMKPFMSWIGNAIGAWAGSGTGGNGGSNLPDTPNGGLPWTLNHRADGGDVYGGQSYLVGERGPELFTPGRTGTITPNHALGGQTTTINAPVYVTVQSDGQTTTKGGDGAQNMKALGQMMAAKCREVIVDESRSGGLLARA